MVALPDERFDVMRLGDDGQLVERLAQPLQGVQVAGPFDLPEIRTLIGSFLDHEDRLNCILINNMCHLA